MAASEGLCRRVVEADRACSLTASVLEEWSGLGAPRQVEYLACFPEAERASREASKRATLLRRCALPAPKTFDGYDWSAVFWPEGSAARGCCRCRSWSAARTSCSWATSAPARPT